MSITLVVPFGYKPVLKHEEHDQSDHGNREGGNVGSSDLQNQAKQFKTFEEFSNAISLGGLRPKAWHIADKDFKLDPDRKPTDRIGSKTREAGLFVGEPKYWQDYATGRETVIEYDLTGLTWTKNPLSDTKADFFTDQSGNQGFFVRSQGFGKLKEVGRFTVEEAISRAEKQQSQMPNSKEEARKIWEGLKKVLKHEEHDQLDHVNREGTGGNNLSIDKVMGLHKTSDPLQKKVYAAETGITRSRSGNLTEKPSAPKSSDFESREDYVKAFKEYEKRWKAWAVEEQSDILSDLGKDLLNGTPSGIRKYVNEVIKEDWFVERFGDGSSLPPLEVKTADTNAAGRHILRMSRDRSTGIVVKSEHAISINRQFVKSESTILHEISHYATAISETKSFESHGVQFAKNHIFVVSKAVGEERANQLREAYKAQGVDLGD